MSEVFCLDCEVAIPLPTSFNKLLANKDSKPVKYKSGWRCSECDEKHRGLKK